jgi:xanthine dehydrogenase accessory factor
VAARLYRTGFHVLISELPQPLVVRRLVSFAEAVYAGKAQVEEITGRLVGGLDEAAKVLEEGIIPVMVDPELRMLAGFNPLVLVDARMIKRPPEIGMESAEMVIGLGPGFIAGENCHAVIETIRGHDMGRVIWQGETAENTGVPEAVLKKQGERVLRAPASGELIAHAHICDHLEQGAPIAEVGGITVTAPFKGVLRGLVHPGVPVKKGMKIGDLDPRDEHRYCVTISDKSLAIGGGVLEAVLSFPNLREKIFSS